MVIKIAHLYPNLLDLYGENGNIKALKKALENKNYKVEIDNIELNEKIKFRDYDFVYMGSGTPYNLDRAQEKLKEYRNDILDYISQDKIMLVTGNALKILAFLDLYEVEKMEEFKVADVVATSALCTDNIVGFQNTEWLIKSTNGIIFNIDKGYGNNGTLMEGFKGNNLYVTSIIGPLLARNEKLCLYFVDLLKELKEN